MKIAVISDTHNHHANLIKALELIESENIQTIIHCGDVTTAETAALLDGYQVILSYGNGDFASGEIRETLEKLNPASFAGLVYHGKIDSLRIAVIHGHHYSQLQNLIHSQQFDVIFTGHTHRHGESRHGITRIINPGAIGGLRKEERSFFILDTLTREGRFIFLD